jgi:hypothetical protein
MFSKSNLISSLIGGIFIFAGGYLVWGMLMADFFEAHAGSATGVSKDPDMLFLAIGCFLQAFFFTAIYGKWSQGVHTAGNGFRLGALVGAFMGFGEFFVWYATSNLHDLTGTLTNGVINVLFMGIAGAIIATVYKAMSK